MSHFWVHRRVLMLQSTNSERCNLLKLKAFARDLNLAKLFLGWLWPLSRELKGEGALWWFVGDQKQPSYVENHGKPNQKGPWLFRVTIFQTPRKKREKGITGITIKQPVLYKWKVRGCSFLCQYEHPVVPFPTCYSDISSVVGSSLEPKKVTTCSSHPNQTCQQKQHKTASKTHIFRTWKWNMLEYVGILFPRFLWGGNFGLFSRAFTQF